jgi:hypothetical protein
MVAGAGAVATVTALAVSPFTASADTGTVSSTTTLKAPPAVTNGHAAIFIAKVAATTKGSGRPTGTVTFTITGSNSATVPCTAANPVTLHKVDRAVCQVAGGLLLPANSPYTVNASYSGDTTFAVSSANASVAVPKSSAKVTLSVDAKPAGKQASTFTATVTGPGAIPTGSVTFVVNAPGHRAKQRCTGGHRQPLGLNDATPPQNVATCSLKAGWLTVRKATKADPTPSSSWYVTALYSGDTNYGSVVSAPLTGVAKS